MFIDNEREFSFVGFSKEAEKLVFLADLNTAVNELKEKISGRYVIVNEINKVLGCD